MGPTMIVGQNKRLGAKRTSPMRGGRIACGGLLQPEALRDVEGEWHRMRLDHATENIALCDVTPYPG